MNPNYLGIRKNGPISNKFKFAKETNKTEIFKASLKIVFGF